MDTALLMAVAEGLEADDLAEMLRQLPETITNQLVGTSIAVIGPDQSLDSPTRKVLPGV